MRSSHTRARAMVQMVWGSSELMYNPLTRTFLTYYNTVTVYISTLVLMLAVLVNLLGW
jgi:hypothetical protein